MECGSPWREQRAVFHRGSEGSSTPRLGSAASARRTDPGCWAPATDWAHSNKRHSHFTIADNRVRLHRWPHNLTHPTLASLGRSEVTEVQIPIQRWSEGEATEAENRSEMIWWIILPEGFGTIMATIIFDNTSSLCIYDIQQKPKIKGFKHRNWSEYK